MPLSPEMVAKEVQDIEQKPWPNDPLLPMKNLLKRDASNFPTFGTLFKLDGQPIPQIVHAGFIELIRNPDGEFRTTAYPSLQAMVEDGWMVD